MGNKDSAWSTRASRNGTGEALWGSSCRKDTPMLFTYSSLYIYKKRKYEYCYSVHAVLRTWSPPFSAPSDVNLTLSCLGHRKRDAYRALRKIAKTGGNEPRCQPTAWGGMLVESEVKLQKAKEKGNKKVRRTEGQCVGAGWDTSTSTS